MKKKKNQEYQFKDFFRLIKIAKVPWYLYIVTFVMDIISSTLFVQLPILLGEIMQGEIFDSWKITKYGLMSIAQILLLILTLILLSWISMKIGIISNVAVWKKSLKAGMSDIDKESPSTLISRVTNDTTYIDMTITGLFNGINIVYSTVLIFFEMYKINYKLSNSLLLVSLWTLLSMNIIGKISYKGQRKIQNTISVFTSYLSERIPNMRIMKAFGNEKFEHKLGISKIQQQYKADIYMVQVNSVSSFLQGVGTALTNSIVLLYGSYLVAKNQMNVGSIVTFYLFVSQGEFTFNIQTILSYYQNIKIGMGGSSKLIEIIDNKDEEVQRKKSFAVPEEDIVFENVSFQYGDDLVLKHLNFVIPKGKVTAIVGPSGSGKTTILKLLERFYTPSNGNIKYGSTDIEDYHLNEWRESIGYVVQNSPLMVGTIRDNILYGVDGDVKEKTLIKASKLANAYDFIMNLEQGFDTEVGELGCKLSGGQKQRVAIARALIKNPDFLLLDEATCSLDACNEYEVLQALNNFMKGRTSVIVAHNITTVRHADNIIVLEEGQIVDMGEHDYLYHKNARYRNYCDLYMA